MTPAPQPHFTKNCMCDKYTNCTDCQAHDTAIRNAVLKEVMEALDEEYYYQGLRWKYQDIIKSLRTGAHK